MKVLVCGGRDFDNPTWLMAELQKLHPTIVMQGGANGADLIARTWALSHCLGSWTFPADWSQWASAGPRRNQFMLEEGKPDVVLAMPGGRGTADMVRRATAAGIKIVQHF